MSIEEVHIRVSGVCGAVAAALRSLARKLASVTVRQQRGAGRGPTAPSLRDSPQVVVERHPHLAAPRLQAVERVELREAELLLW